MSKTSHARRRLLTALAVLSALSCGVAAAAETYPAKPIRLIVPFAAGGGNDVVARLLAQRLEPLLGQPLVVENRAGAGGNLGTEAAAKSPPDGYTLVHVANTVVMNPYVFRKMPFDIKKDLVPVAIVATSPLWLLVNANVPVQTFAELMQRARQGKGQMSYASPGNGTPHHFAMELLKARAGVDIVHIPYKGGALALTDVLGGQVPVLMATPQSVLDHVASGKLRLLASLEPARSSAHAQIPTVAETHADVQVSIWQELMAPAGTPDAVIKTLSGALAKALDDPELQKRLLATGFSAYYESPDKMKTRIAGELEQWKKVAESAGMVPE
jgi:tripartite-type tricarboxylate transporter receptor subunit TctC